jgi:hypothetical protein
VGLDNSNQDLVGFGKLLNLLISKNSKFKFFCTSLSTKLKASKSNENSLINVKALQVKSNNTSISYVHDYYLKNVADYLIFLNTDHKLNKIDLGLFILDYKGSSVVFNYDYFNKINKFDYTYKKLTI